MTWKHSATRALAVGGLSIGLAGGVLYASGASDEVLHGPPAGQDGTAEQAHVIGPSEVRTAAARAAAKRKAAIPAAIRFGWRATSPGTHQGDRYSLTIRNGAIPQQLAVQVGIMDHANHTTTPVVTELLTLAANETRTLTAENTYGTANHFVTRIGSEHQDLTFDVRIADDEGAVATFNQRAFLVAPRAAKPRHKEGATHPAPTPVAESGAQQ